MSLSSDAALSHMVFCDSVLPGHPLARFAWGNKRSLLNGETSRGYSALLERLKAWYEVNYRIMPSPTSSGGDSVDALHRMERRMQLVVRANGALLQEEQEKDGISVGSLAAGSPDQTAKAHALDAIERVVRAALRPLTAAWDRTLREQRKYQRQAKQRAKVHGASRKEVVTLQSHRARCLAEEYIDAATALNEAVSAVSASTALSPCTTWATICQRLTDPSTVSPTSTARGPEFAASNPLRMWRPELCAAEGPEPSRTFDALTRFGHPLVYFLVPVEAAHTVTLTWCLPPLQRWRVERPADLIGHLLGHEATGSVLHALRSRSWATALEAGLSWDVGEDSNCACALMRVRVTATPLGLIAWKSIVSLVHSFILHVLCRGRHPGFQCEMSRVAPSTTTAYAVARDQTPSCQLGKKKQASSAPSVCAGMKTLGGVAHPASSSVLKLGPVSSLNVSVCDIESLASAMAELAPWHAESAAIDSMEYDFSEDPDDPVESVTRHAVAMVLGASPTDVLPAWRRLSPHFCAAATAVLVAHLHPGNLRVDVSSPSAAALLEAAGASSLPSESSPDD
jgi:hypothetical protein